MNDVVEVTGTGSASAAPDLVTIHLRLQCPADTVAEALNALQHRSQQALDTARAFDPAPVSLSTTGLGVHQHHDRHGQPSGHLAYQSLALRLTAPERAGALIASIGQVSGDSLAVDSLDLGIADPEPLLQRARTAAFADARAKAEHYATLAGRGLGQVRSVRESNEPGLPRPMMAKAMAAQDASIPVAAGDQEVQVGVVISWSLD